MTVGLSEQQWSWVCLFCCALTILQETTPQNFHDIGAMHGSFDRFGFVAPFILDDGNGELVAGHGRLDALAQKFARGEDPPPRIVVNGKGWLVPVVRGVTFASEREAEAYCLADNRLCELGGWDSKQLSEVLSEFAHDGEEMLKGIGFDMDDLNSLLAGNALGKGPVEKAPSEITCPSCGHHFMK